EMDIPSLIPGVDVGEEPTPFQQAQALAADAWGAKRSWFLLNGASQGNHAACLALRHAGRRIVVQRNAHSSVVDGAVLAGLEPTFVAPELDADLGIAHCVTPERLESALAVTPDAVGVICVSPTYFGACADVGALAAVAHRRGVPLVVDEAWGAHLRFSPELPISALESGADMTISSTHKIVGSLTQSAIVHVGHESLIDEQVVDRVVTLLESTSPSSLLTLSLDAARRLAATQGAGLLAETLETLRSVRDRIRAIPPLDVLDERLVSPGVAGWDPLRLTVDVRATGITGHEFARLLREADVFCELSTEAVVVAAFGMGGRAGPLAERFVTALGQVVRGLGSHDPQHGVPFAVPPPWGPMEMVPRDAFFGPQEPVSFAAAEGRIAAESLAAYPPGIPNVLPGERLTRETLEFIAETVGHGGYLRGASDRTLETIRVAIED
ncbi:MAG: aminotransferase class V-fold PLP-dependent enzyme, partial [Actinomycetota bacterium]|nr:aminotransferase class V-fold PLP-dependent enzyme [Actinomycetota bacterium]